MFSPSDSLAGSDSDSNLDAESRSSTSPGSSMIESDILLLPGGVIFFVELYVTLL